ncbi:MAG: BrnT family toxin [Spirochaetota bacterium]
MEHSCDEDRWMVIGRAGKELVLFVICAELHNKIRLISARKATPNERRRYDEKLHTYFQNQID